MRWSSLRGRGEALTGAGTQNSCDRLSHEHRKRPVFIVSLHRTRGVRTCEYSEGVVRCSISSDS